MITRQGFFHDIQLKYLANSGFSWPSLLRDSDNVWHDWLQQLHVESWRLFSDHILPHSFRYFLCYIQRSWFFWCSSEKGWLYKKSNLLAWFLYENCQQKCKYRHFWTPLKTILLIKCQMSHQFEYPQYIPLPHVSQSHRHPKIRRMGSGSSVAHHLEVMSRTWVERGVHWASKPSTLTRKPMEMGLFNHLLNNFKPSTWNATWGGHNCWIYFTNIRFNF